MQKQLEFYVTIEKSLKFGEENVMPLFTSIGKERNENTAKKVVLICTCATLESFSVTTDKFSKN